MCGVVGIAAAAGGVRIEELESMARRQAPRGPDGIGALVADDGGTGLGMNLLAVVNSSVRPGPYLDPASGVLLTYNGEVYNYRELAAQWGIQLLPGESDAHLVLRAYIRFGPTCLQSFDGMFALAVYDPRHRRLFLARDRFGEKPLYYRLDTERLVFASEVKALGAVTALRPRFVPEWLTIESPLGSDTPYEDVELLEPGTHLTLDLRTWAVTKHSWWSIERGPGGAPTELGDARDAFDSLLRPAVERRSHADDALMLSGGLDSAVLAFLLRPSVLLTVRYAGQDRYDEFGLAQKVAKAVGSELVVVEPTAEDFRAHAESIVHFLDYPMGNASLLSEYMLYARAAELGVRVVHGGIGPDELLLGYVRHSLALDGPAAVSAPGLSSYLPLQKRFEKAATRRASAADRYYRLILRGPDQTANTRRLVHQCFARSRDLGQAVSLVDLHTAFPPLLLTSDKLASAFGIERRSPFLAHEWAEFCFDLPIGLKRDGAYTKRLLRDFARGLGVPAKIWGQVDKRGFGSPVPQWLSSSLSEWCDGHLRFLQEESAPELARLVGRQARGSLSKFDRSRFHGLMMSLWWQRNGGPSPLPSMVDSVTSSL
jgi:asparagine synthase (glutamine-hydrolysing)